MLMAHTDHALGDVVGRYRLLGEMARGGMGIVYVAAAQGPAGFSKLVALKELRPDLVEDEEFLTMFLEEARMAARLNHPNIVQTNDVDEYQGRHFIAMEYLEGRSLYNVVKRFAARGGFPQRLALSVLRDVLSALDYAHELSGFDGKPLGFVHRDVSPHNIFVTFEGHTKVIDFGIAKARDSSLETKTGVLKGRANYMAPEQLTRRADRRSDIFSVGAVLFEMLSGRRLWHGMGEIEILAALTRGEIPSLHAVRPDTPAALVQICERALAARPDDRFTTAAEMRDALDQHLWATGGAPRHRDLADALAQEFEAERQRVRGIIEAALYRLQAGESGRLEALDIRDPRDAVHDSRRGSSRSHVGNFTGERSLHNAPSLSAVRHTPSRVGHASGAVAQHTPSALTSRPGVPLTSVRSGDPLPAVVPELLEPLDAPGLITRIWNGQPWLVTGLFATVFLATTAMVALHHPVPPPAPEPLPPPPVVTAAAAPARPAPPETIVLSVSVAPSSATIAIDGQPMPSNPFVGHFLKSAGTHRLRATAPGHVAKERLVSFDDNVMVDLSLVPQPSSAPAARSGSSERGSSRRESQRHFEPPARHEPPPPPMRPAAIATAPAPAPAAAPERKSANDIVPRGEWEPPRKRVIDTSNPYGDEK